MYTGVIAYGAVNLVGAFFRPFTAAGSLFHSTIQANSEGKTQLVSLVSSGIILIVLVGLSFLF
jgi:MFS superfamily sulfate permease-like transporter